MFIFKIINDYIDHPDIPLWSFILHSTLFSCTYPGLCLHFTIAKSVASIINSIITIRISWATKERCAFSENTRVNHLQASRTAISGIFSLLESAVDRFRSECHEYSMLSSFARRHSGDTREKVERTRIDFVAVRNCVHDDDDDGDVHRVHVCMWPDRALARKYAKRAYGKAPGGRHSYLGARESRLRLD